MKKTSKDHVEKLNRIIAKASEASSETIKAIITASSKGLNSSIDSNQEFLELIKNQLRATGLDSNLITTVKSSFAMGIDVSEQMIDAIITAHSKRLESSIEFNVRLLELLIDQQFSSDIEMEKTFAHILKNFESGFNASHDELKDILEFYNKHVNIALNFNHKFARVFKNQIETINKLQNSNVNIFTNQAAQWWKESVSDN